MPMKPNKIFSKAAMSLGYLALAVAANAQTVTNPVSNRVISWNLDDWSTVNPTDLAGLAPATNWVDTYLNNVTTSLPDNTGATTTLNLAYASYNTWHVQANHAGYDANGTANREMLNGYLNAGPASWAPYITNTYVALTNIPYAQYDVIVYFNSDTSGRHASIDNGTTTNYFSTVGSPSRSSANALFIPTTQTDSSSFPTADFAFFPGMTSPNAVITEIPLSGNDQWLGIAAFQVVQSSNVYVVYGPSPASATVPLGQPASFNVMAGGLNRSYQWRHNGTNILNATNSTYAIAATVSGQDGNYDVIVSNSLSAVTSVVSTLTFYTPKIVEWDGNGTAWDTSSLFWTANGGVSTTNYTETDNVLFSPLGSAQPTVSLASTFTPSSITISNSNYTLTAGGISGVGLLHLKNGGLLILDTVDTRTGPTVIDPGSILQLDNGDTAGSLGAGPMTNNGALLFNAAGDEAYGYPVYGSGSITNLGSGGTITLGNNLNANYLVQQGTGNLLLQGSNSLSGGLIVSGGSLWGRAANCLGTAPVQVTGGELQLIFNIDFTGSTLTLAGGLLHGGIGGSATCEPQVILGSDSTIQVDSGNSLTLANPAGLNGGTHNLSQGGTGTLILAGGNNSWGSVTINGTLQIGKGGAGSVGAGTITDTGTLLFNAAGTVLVTNPVTGPGFINQNGPGTVILSGDNNAAGYIGYINVTNGTLLLNGTSGPGIVTVGGGTLGGTGTIGGPVTVVPGATLAPGGVSSIGTLSLSSDLNLGGNLLVQVNKSLSPSNSITTVGGALNNTGTGVVTVNNLGPALHVGDKFQLFDKPVANGSALAMSTAGGIIWSNNLAVDGTISVVSTVVPHPVVNNAHLNGSDFVFQGTNGLPLWPFYVLTSTNLAAGPSGWTRMSTNAFDASGNFNITNSTGAADAFFRLQLQ